MYSIIVYKENCSFEKNTNRFLYRNSLISLNNLNCILVNLSKHASIPDQYVYIYIFPNRGFLFDAHRSMLVLNGEVIGDCVSTPTAFTILFGSCYMFNIRYPGSAIITLEIIQMYLQDEL